MQLLSKHPKWVRVQPYPCFVAIAFSKSDAEYMKSIAPHYFDDDAGVLGYVDDISENRYIVGLNVGCDDFGYHIIAHEGVHFVNGVMRFSGFPPTREWCCDEPDAYLMGWYVNFIESEWTRRTGTKLENYIGSKNESKI